jgi:hypothetical protein
LLAQTLGFRHLLGVHVFDMPRTGTIAVYGFQNATTRTKRKEIAVGTLDCIHSGGPAQLGTTAFRLTGSPKDRATHGIEQFGYKFQVTLEVAIRKSPSALRAGAFALQYCHGQAADAQVTRNAPKARGKEMPRAGRPRRLHCQALHCPSAHVHRDPFAFEQLPRLGTGGGSNEPALLQQWPQSSDSHGFICASAQSTAEPEWQRAT